jgi:adenylate cyclase
MVGDRVQRRLAAILVADVAGYSRLMGSDDEGTLAGLKAGRELIDLKSKEHRGRIVNTPGDSALVEFASAVDAARCAVEIQKEMAQRNAVIPEDRRIEFRIGINVGDVIVDDRGDIYGDGVNIAARVETLAKPGMLCLSDEAYRQIRGKLRIEVSDMGEHQLKNIEQPVRVYSVWLDDAPPLALPDKASIAVLPFENLSGDPKQEYFADGVSEDIITELSRFSDLFVIARNSSFKYKGKAVDVRQVGRELGVRYALEGSIRRGGDRVRISAQLVDSGTGAHRWAERYAGTEGCLRNPGRGCSHYRGGSRGPCEQSGGRANLAKATRDLAGLRPLYARRRRLGVLPVVVEIGSATGNTTASRRLAENRSQICACLFPPG